MKKYEGYEQAQAFTGDFEQLPTGGYVCRILKIVSEDKDYGTLLRIGFDIEEGEHKEYYKRRYNSAVESNPDAKWQGMYYQTVKQDDLKYFKGFITVIEKSNTGYSWEKADWNEKTLVGKLFGGVFGEEEYLGNDGKIKVSVKCVQVRSVEQVRKGAIVIPPIKSLSPSASIASYQQNTSSYRKPDTFDTGDDLPF